MIVKLFDGTELLVSREVGEKVANSLRKSGEGMITLNGFLLKKSAIAYIRQGGHLAVDLESQQQLEARTATRRIGSGADIGHILDKHNLNGVK